MDKIIITGKTRKAEYAIDLDTRQVNHIKTEIIDANADIVGENFVVSYYCKDDETPFFEDMWCVLHGIPEDVVERLTECPYALIDEYCEKILSIAKNSSASDTIYITFEGERPMLYSYVSKTKQYKAMRSCQKTIMASLYKVKRDKMILLQDYTLEDDEEELVTMTKEEWEAYIHQMATGNW